MKTASMKFAETNMEEVNREEGKKVPMNLYRTWTGLDDSGSVHLASGLTQTASKRNQIRFVSILLIN